MAPKLAFGVEKFLVVAGRGHRIVFQIHRLDRFRRIPRVLDIDLPALRILRRISDGVDAASASEIRAEWMPFSSRFSAILSTAYPLPIRLGRYPCRFSRTYSLIRRIEEKTLVAGLVSRRLHFGAMRQVGRSLFIEAPDFHQR